MSGEVLGQLVTGEVVTGDDASDCPDLFEDCQIPIDAGLREATIGIEDLVDGHRAATGTENVDESTASRGEPLIRLAEQAGDLVIDVVRGHGRHPISVVMVGIVEDELAADPHETPAKGLT